MFLKRFLSYGFAVALLLPAFGSAQAQVKPSRTDIGIDNPTSALYIGNSFFYYNNSMHGHVTNLLRSADDKYRFRSVSATISGSGFDWHDVESYFRPKALSSYSFDAKNNIVFNKLERLFDVAIMMDCSQCPVHPELKTVFKEFAKKHVDTVRKNGAKPVFFMSWAYADAPEMTRTLADAYVQAGNELDVFVIPAGLAFAKSIAIKPELNLYVADLRHPSMAGTYLASCVTYASLFKRSPVGLKYTAGLDEATAAHLQNVAWTTYQDFIRK